MPKLAGSRCSMICGRYDLGVGKWKIRGLKYCSICSIAVDPKYRNCPCCNYKLRNRTIKAKEKEGAFRY